MKWQQTILVVSPLQDYDYSAIDVSSPNTPDHDRSKMPLQLSLILDALQAGEPRAEADFLLRLPQI